MSCISVDVCGLIDSGQPWMPSKVSPQIPLGYPTENLHIEVTTSDKKEFDRFILLLRLLAKIVEIAECGCKSQALCNSLCSVAIVTITLTSGCPTWSHQ